MNKNLLNKIVAHSTENNDTNLTKEETTELLRMYLNDRNSSTLRELITLEVSKVLSIDKKLSYDGYDIYGNYYEVKPMNISSTSSKKLDGSGSYNDLTWARHRKYLNECPLVLISGFVDGRLCYIFEVPYITFKEKIEEKLMKYIGETDKKFQYLRSFKFTYKDWVESPNLNIVYITQKDELLSSMFYNHKFWKFLNKNKNINFMKGLHYPFTRLIEAV